MAVEVEIDVEVLKSEIKKTYASVSQEPEKDFIFPTGRPWAEDLDYPDELANVPETAVGSFAGVASPWQLGRLAPGERVLDLGSGAGTDSLLAAQMVGEHGHVTGIDMTPEMLTKGACGGGRDGCGERRVRGERGGAVAVPGRELRRCDLERRDRPDPRQGRRLREISRVVAPGGRIQIADVTIQNPVSAEGRRNIDLWTG
jgi:arsenite methyltransferase